MNSILLFWNVFQVLKAPPLGQVGGRLRVLAADVLYACMLCIYTCMYVYKYVCVHVCMCACMYVYMFVCVGGRLSVLPKQK